MNALAVTLILMSLILLAAGCWLGWQLLRQNGRILLRLDDLEQRLNEIEFGESQTESGEDSNQEAQTRAAANGEDRANRFRGRSLLHSRINRDGLKAGTPAPEFRLPRLDGRGDLDLGMLRGRPALLVFSDPHCGPCNSLAPQLEAWHREHLEFQIVMISRGEPTENRAKVKEHELTFPIVLQRQWEISRRYAMFATPIAYLIDEAGIITHEVALGVEAILDLAKAARVVSVAALAAA